MAGYEDSEYSVSFIATTKENLSSLESVGGRLIQITDSDRNEFYYEDIETKKRHPITPIFVKDNLDSEVKYKNAMYFTSEGIYTCDGDKFIRLELISRRDDGEGNAVTSITIDTDSCTLVAHKDKIFVETSNVDSSLSSSSINPVQNQAVSSAITSVNNKVDGHVSSHNNPHRVTTGQIEVTDDKNFISSDALAKIGCLSFNVDGSVNVTIDSALSETSTNPVQNKVVYSGIMSVNDKVDNHISNRDNPHHVTVSQVEGAAEKVHTHNLKDILDISINTEASAIQMDSEVSSAGSGTSVALANHVHPTDTSRAAIGHTHTARDIEPTSDRQFITALERSSLSKLDSLYPAVHQGSDEEQMNMDSPDSHQIYIGWHYSKEEKTSSLLAHIDETPLGGILTSGTADTTTLPVRKISGYDDASGANYRAMQRIVDALGFSNKNLISGMFLDAFTMQPKVTEIVDKEFTGNTVILEVKGYPDPKNDQSPPSYYFNLGNFGKLTWSMYTNNARRWTASCKYDPECPSSSKCVISYSTSGASSQGNLRALYTVIGTSSSEILKYRLIVGLILIDFLSHIKQSSYFIPSSWVTTHNKLYKELTGQTGNVTIITEEILEEDGNSISEVRSLSGILPGGLRVASLSYAGFFSKGYVTLSFYVKVSGNTDAFVVNVAVIPRSIYEGDVDFSKWSAGEGDKLEGTVYQITLPSKTKDQWFKVSKTFDLSNIDPLTDSLYVVLDSFSPKNGTLRVVSFSDIKLEYGRYSTRFDPNYIDDLDMYRNYQGYLVEVNAPSSSSAVSTMSITDDSSTSTDSNSTLESVISSYANEFYDILSETGEGGSLADPRLLRLYGKVCRLSESLSESNRGGEVVEQ